MVFAVSLSTLKSAKRSQGLFEAFSNEATSVSPCWFVSMATDTAVAPTVGGSCVVTGNVRHS